MPTTAGSAPLQSQSQQPIGAAGAGTAGGEHLLQLREVSPTGTFQPTGITGAAGQQQSQAQHHPGRDAALTGATGATALGAYEAHKHHNEPQSAAQSYQPQSHSQHHAARDTTLAGATGATALGAYEADKHHNQHQAMQSDQVPQSATQAYQPQPRSQHHTGRDVALVGATGATGLGAYEAEKHHREHEASRGQAGPLAATSGNQTAGSSGDVDQLYSHYLDQSDGTAGVRHGKADKLLGRDEDTESSQQQHHYGRDTALVGGAGAAAYEAEKHHHGHTEEQQAERRLHKEQKHEAHEARREAHDHKFAEETHHDGKEKKHGGLLGFLHRDKTDEETPEEKDRRRHENDKAITASLAEHGLTRRERQHESHSEREARHHGEHQQLDSRGERSLDGDSLGEGEKHHHHINVSDQSGRNRLHKEPPASHPAAQSSEDPAFAANPTRDPAQF